MKRNELIIVLLAAGAVGVLAVAAAIAVWGRLILLPLALLLIGGGFAGYRWIKARPPTLHPQRTPGKRGVVAMPAARPARRSASVRIASLSGGTAPLDRLLALSPDEFEEFVRLLFAASGLYQDVRRVGRSGDGGMDLTMRDGAGNLCVVQCKRYKGTVPAGQIRDLAGVMMLQRPREAYFVTTGRVSAGAQAALGSHLLHVWDGERLVRYARQWLGPRLEETIERARRDTRRAPES